MRKATCVLVTTLAVAAGGALYYLYCKRRRSLDTQKKIDDDIVDKSNKSVDVVDPDVFIAVKVHGRVLDEDDIVHENNSDKELTLNLNRDFPKARVTTRISAEVEEVTNRDNVSELLKVLFGVNIDIIRKKKEKIGGYIEASEKMDVETLGKTEDGADAEKNIEEIKMAKETVLLFADVNVKGLDGQNDSDSKGDLKSRRDSLVLVGEVYVPVEELYQLCDNSRVIDDDEFGARVRVFSDDRDGSGQTKLVLKVDVTAIELMQSEIREIGETGDEDEKHSEVSLDHIIG
ncbi:uncharacterized protein LOC144357851 [Saccoglossus kowalevskii]